MSSHAKQGQEDEEESQEQNRWEGSDRRRGTEQVGGRNRWGVTAQSGGSERLTLSKQEFHHVTSWRLKPGQQKVERRHSSQQILEEYTQAAPVISSCSPGR